jgi:deoxyribonuclease-4
MPLFGAHLSVAGGLHKAVDSAVALGMETVQLFTKNANQWVGKPLAEESIDAFRKSLAASGLRYAAAHDSYLINLAAPDDQLYRRSIEAFVDEVERAEALGLDYLVTHPGAHTGSGEEAGLKRVIAALDEVGKRCAGYRVKILIETTAGQGSSLGHRFEHIATLLRGVKDASMLGVCVDTCHIFAAGYALGTAAEYEATFQEFDRVVGLAHLALFHLNDSVRELGSRVDRHAGLGLGQIGARPFERIVKDARFHSLPMILETPKENDEGEAMDPVNLAILQKFRGKKKKPSAG